MLGGLLRKLAGLGEADPLPPVIAIPAAAPPSSGTPAAQREYFIARLSGRCGDGAERDGGTRYHAVAGWRALCGAAPGRASAGWSEHEGHAVTCPRCEKKINKSKEK